MKTISIIWAGAAGLMTAATILEREEQNFHIHIFEKNSTPWKKVIISGGGRCNVTTGITDKKILETKYTRGWNFIKKAIGKFWPKKTYEWFESHGVPLKCEKDNRVFPVSDDGTEVVEVFEKVFAKYCDKITFHYTEGVSAVIKVGEKYQITTSKWLYESDVLVITTWGNAYSHTGSTGDGYSFARSFGHSITPLWPSLSSFLTKETWLHACSGIAFEKAKIGSLIWPILLTHFGISWPLAFMFSSTVAWEKIDKNNPQRIIFSPLAEWGKNDWDEFLKKEFATSPKKRIGSILAEKLPKRFVEGFVTHLFSWLEDVFVSSLWKKEREEIAKLLGEWIPLTLLERRPGDEFVTAGWVNTDEINPETCESKIQKNLYFAGEVLNVDGYTGGFSLQICWSSGYVVGVNCDIY